MAAGQGFKTFTTGEVLTAADVNGYLMQGVGVFTDATNRDAEITSPQEGQFAYLKDTNVTTYYTGSAWANLDTTGMTNPMTTTGDTIYSSSGSTPARLGIGTNGQVLTSNGTIPTWSTTTSGGMTLLSTTSLSGTSTTVSSISQAYTNLLVIVKGFTMSATAVVIIKPNNIGGDASFAIAGTLGSGQFQNRTSNGAGSAQSVFSLLLYDYANTTTNKAATHAGESVNSGDSFFGGGAWGSTSAITSMVITTTGGTATFSTGTVQIYGVK